MKAVPAGNLTEMVGKYVSEKAGVNLTSGMYAAFAIFNDQNVFCAGVVVHGFRDVDCEISVASETPVAWRPGIMRAVFHYVFVQLGCVRCTSITTKKNKRARKFLEKLGFELEGNVRKGYDGKIDALIYGLLRSECRYLPENQGETPNGQKIKPESSSGSGPGSDGASAVAVQQGSGGSASEPEPYQSSDPAGIADVHADWY